MEEDTPAVREMRACLNRLVFKYPGLSRLTRWPVKHSDQVTGGTAAVSAGAFWVGNKFLDLPPDERGGVALHEVMHILYQHVWRFHDIADDTNLPWASLDPAEKRAIVNRAADYIVNLDVLAAGYSLPSETLVNPDYAGLGLREAVRKVLRDGEGKPPPPPAGGGNQQGDEWGSILPANRRDASTALGEGYSPEEGAVIARRITGRVQPVPVDVYLRRHLMRGGTKRATWARPSRFGALVPGHRKREASVLVLLVDCSGSIDETTAKLFRKLAAGIPPATVTHVLFANTRIVNRAENITNPDEIPLAWDHCIAGGGTRLIEPLKDAIEEYNPTHVIYLTDGECGVEAPEYVETDMLWVVHNDRALSHPRLMTTALNSAIRVNEDGAVVETRGY